MAMKNGPTKIHSLDSCTSGSNSVGSVSVAILLLLMAGTTNGGGKVPVATSFAHFTQLHSTKCCTKVDNLRLV